MTDRLETLRAVRGAGIEMCCGGIIGMGEGVRDRAAMLQVLASFDPHPESVPINALVPVAGTPLAGKRKVEPLDLVRMIATARIVMPRGARATLRRALEPVDRGAGALHDGRRQLDLLRRDAADDAERRRRRGRRAVHRARRPDARRPPMAQ